MDEDIILELTNKVDRLSKELENINYRLDNDKFFNLIIPDKMAWISKQELYDEYTKVCKYNNTSRMSVVNFFEEIKKRFKVSEYLAHREDESRVRSFKGIAWLKKVNYDEF